MKKKKSDITREKILDISKQLFYEKGFGKTSVRDIAKLCDINQSLVYYYFQNKQSLAFAIMEEFSEKVQKVMEVCLDYEKDPILFMLCYVRMLIKEVSVSKIDFDFYCELFYKPPADRPFVHRMYRALQGYMQDETLSFEVVKIAQVISDSVWEGLMSAKQKGDIHMSIEEIQNQVDRERYLYIGMEKAEIEKKIRDASDIVKLIPTHNIHLIKQN